MDLDTLREYCLTFPGATEKLQWGDNLCLKVGGKIFVILTLDSVPPQVSFKCSPERFAELTERAGIVPAPYVGRYKWVLVEGLNRLPDSELRQLIRESYDAVAAKVKRPRAKSRRRTGGKAKKNSPDDGKGLAFDSVSLLG